MSIYFPRPTGSYAVAAGILYFEDHTRKETLVRDRKHPYRELLVHVWYPSEGTLQKTPDFHYFIPRLAYAENQSWLGRLRTWLRNKTVEHVYSYSIPDGAFSHEQQSYPVILLSPALGSTADLYIAYAEELASHGYIVVGVNHTYYCNSVKFPDGRIMSKRILNEKYKNAREIDRFKAMDQWIETWIDDVEFVLAGIKQLNGDPSSFFYQRFDFEHMGMMGHSFGGATTTQLCRRDTRLKACVNIDGRLHGKDLTKPFDTPYMLILAEELVKRKQKPVTDVELAKLGITREEDEYMKQRYMPALEELRSKLSGDIYTYIVKGADHLDLSDRALLKNMRNYKKLFGDYGVGPIDGYRAIAIVNACLVNFFDTYLKGKPSELLSDPERVCKK
jgi:predicted dienelactone hydrolase